jgi:hypothetical protein
VSYVFRFELLDRTGSDLVVQDPLISLCFTKPGMARYGPGLASFGSFALVDSVIHP